MGRRAAACIYALGLTMAPVACAPSQGTVALSEPDVQDYIDYVHPILEPSCATLDCHGDVRRPLQLYAETGLRMRDDLRNQPMTQQEYEANVLAVAGVAPNPTAVDDDVVLTKPLAVSAGGLHHKGRDLWPSRSDPAYVCVRAWLVGQPITGQVATECTLAAQAVALPPP